MTTPDQASSIVLGDSGFIGRALSVSLKQRGGAVHGYSSATLDLRDAGALSSLDPVLTDDATVFIAAALTPNRGVGLDALADHLKMLVNLSRYLETHPARLYVYFSSDAVYPMVDHPVDETTAVEPATVYPLAKYAGERMLQHAAERNGTPLLSLRPTGVFGPGDTHAAYGPNGFVNSAVADGCVRVFGGGEELRDHIYIDDVVRCACQLAFAAPETDTLNLATGVSRTFMSIAEDIRTLTPGAIQLVQGERRSPITHRTFDIARLRKRLPDFAFTPFIDGLSSTLQAARR